MIKYIGVDGCRAGWFAVGFGNGKEWDIGVFSNISSLCKHYSKARLILIDIPIGLSDKGVKERTCDIEARRILGPKRGTSIFLVPCRAVLCVNSYRKACIINKELSGRSISKQAWQIVPKIREVDEFIRLQSRCSRRRPTRRGGYPDLRETHPEICFWALAGRPMQYWKKTRLGCKERLAILRMAFSNTDDIINEAKIRYRRKDVPRPCVQGRGVAIDDILDALAVALISRKGIKKLVSIPKNPEYDSCGLRMEIVCAMH